MPVGYNEDVSFLLRQARLAAGITQQELADRGRVQQPTIARFERGDRLPRLDTAARLARALDTTIDSLWEPEDVA